jgi:tetratricopeptide (TPR) repeat protein
MDLTYFNPNSQKEEDFIASFVARQETLGFFLKQLSLTHHGQAARHHLIVAPRGFGKTSLLRRIAIGVRSDASLYQRFIPLRFREEQHNVISLDVLWRNCLQSLLEAREDEGAPQSELDALDAAWEAHAPRQTLPREEQDGEPAWHTLREHCDALQRRPVLLIDNLDTLLAGLSTQHQWGLRKRLQADDGPVLIAAASRYPEATHDPQAAFFEFFRIQPLERLTNQDVFTCLRNIAAHRGAAGRRVMRTLDTEPGRVAALNTLAGGNPRTLSVLYGVIESDMSGDALSQLSAMLDTFTGWYQARTEELPVQARAVFDALALNWDPMTAFALGQATGLETSAVSSQLTRLEKSGYVEPVALTRGKVGRSGYQVGERFFNIWYLMRNGPRRARQKIRFLTNILHSFYSLKERRTLAQEVLLDQTADPGYVLALASGFNSKRLRGSLLQHAKLRSNQAGKTSEYTTLVDELHSEWNLGDQSESKPEDQRGLSPALDTKVHSSPQYPNKSTGRQSKAEEKAIALFGEARRLAKQGQSKQAIELYDKLLAQIGEAKDLTLRKLVAMALVNKGNRLGILGNGAQAIETYEEVDKRFGAAGEPALNAVIARALLYKGFELGTIGRSQQAIETFDQVLNRFGSSTEPALRIQVAMAMFNKGNRLGILGRAEQEIAQYDEVVERYGAADDPELREPVARALVNKGATLGAIDRSELAIDVYQEVVRRFGGATEVALLEQVAMALVNKGHRLGALGRIENEIGAYDEVIARFGALGEPALLEAVAKALVNKGIALKALDRTQQAIDVYDNVVERFGAATELPLRQEVAIALVNKGYGMSALGQTEQAINIYDDVVARFGSANEPALCKQVGKALFNKGVRLGATGAVEKAIDAYDAIVARFGQASDTELRKQVAHALFNKGFTLNALGRSEEAIVALDEVLTRYGETAEQELRVPVAKALVSKAIALGALGRIEQEIQTYDLTVSSFGLATEPALREQAAMALFNKGTTLLESGRPADAVVAYDKVVERFDTPAEPVLAELAAMAFFRKGVLLQGLNLLNDSEQAYREAMKRRPNNGDLHVHLGNLLQDYKGEIGSARNTYEAGLAAASDPRDKYVLHANMAYLLALNNGDAIGAQEHVVHAISADSTISTAGKFLLEALLDTAAQPTWNWSIVFYAIGKAVASEDGALWTHYADDLERLLWHILNKGKGADFKQWMEAAGYPMQYAPLYHAFVAGLEGEDHLLQINPETREPASKIYAGIARRLKLFGTEAQRKHPPGRAKREK